mgnify:FL=1
MKINEFDKEQLKLLLNDLQDIDKFTGFKDGAFKYELGKYQANLLVNYIKNQEEVIDRKKYLLKQQGSELKELYSEIDKLQGRIDKAIEYLEAPNRDSFDYSKAELLDILSEVSE